MPTFAEWWDSYRETYEPSKSENTQRRDREIVGHWLPLMGSQPLDEVKQIDCQRAIQSRRRSNTAHKTRKTKTRLTEDSVQRERRLVQAIFQRAVDSDIIAKNPFKGIKGHKSATRAHRILTEENEAKLIAALNTPQRDAAGRMVSIDPRYTRWVRFMLETGIRIDELLNDSFRDQGAVIRVIGKGLKDREVALTTKARGILDEQWKDQGDDRFPRPDSRHPWWQSQQRFRDVMTEGCKRAGIAHLGPHDLRHSYGHRFLVKGGDIYTLSKVLGHASVAVTEKHYAYLRNEDIHAKALAVMEPDAAAEAKPARRLVAVK